MFLKFNQQVPIFLSKFPSYLSITDDPSSTLQSLLTQWEPDIIVMLVDENTAKLCLPKINLKRPYVIEIKSGEEQKNLSTCEFIWKRMTQLGLTRNSVLINLGGGVIGDMGGFAASTYKRGIRFINIPTTLLAQVDASIGGKLGIDFDELKNHLGIFREPDHVIVWPEFLKTLPKRELVSGFAEVAKHALISDKDHWENLKSIDRESHDWKTLIPHSIKIKSQIVFEDPNESGYRKILNFGHTLGHAIESYFLNTEKRLLHGEAIAIGMILESHISWQKGWLTEIEFQEISSFLRERFKPSTKLPKLDILMPFLLQDKKNDAEGINFSLLKGIGNCEYDVKLDMKMIERSLQEYRLK